MSTRRAFLIRSARLAGGLLVLELAACRPAPPADGRIALDVARLLPEGAAALGRLALDEAPGDAAGLAAALFPSAPAPDADPEALVRVLAAQVREEHHAGKARSLNGWRLAPTEITLCALAALA